MAKRKKIKQKEYNHLLALGTLMLSNEGLIELTIKLREKYKINLKEREWNLHYEEKIEDDGTKRKIRKEVEGYLTNVQRENESSHFLDSFISSLAKIGDQKVIDVWDQVRKSLFKLTKQMVDEMGDMTVNQLLKELDLDYAQGKVFVNELTEFIITDELQPFPPEYIGSVITQIPDTVITVSTPLTIQESIVELSKSAMREKFPASSRNIDDRIAAACYAYRKMGLSNKKIALKVYDINPNRRDYDAELKRKANLISKKINKINKIIKLRL